MRDAPITLVMDAILDVGRAAMLTRYAPNSCIAGVAIACEALWAYGYSGYPVVVSTRVANPASAAWTDEQRALGWPDPPSRPRPADGWNVDLGLPETPVVGRGGLTAGRELHMVAFVEDGAPDEGWLLDPTLDQAARPARGIHVEPSRLRIGPDEGPRWLAGEATLGWHDRDGGLVLYTVRPGVTWYRSSPNWGRRDAAVRARIVGAIVGAIDAGIGRADA
jgi:hypothetical protein